MNINETKHNENDISDDCGNIYQGQEIIFALDIGTRSVVGIVGAKQDDKIKIIDFEIIEHSKRAMIDGQIEDIYQVSNVIKNVKGNLENRLGIKLKKVAIAAAGRALKTEIASAFRELRPNDVIENEHVWGLEGEAIELAHDQLNIQFEQLGDKNQFYCVGYSVTNYFLDDHKIANLAGHRGNRASVELIAAFLPRAVVEGLYAAVDMNGLEVSSLTLEPIAAMNLLVPKDLRLLNIALVDIGAGTSDIAITNGGTIVTYKMATIAGDEITEAIVQKYLVDFSTAEKIKISLGSDLPEVSYMDILGFEYSIPVNEIIEAIKETIKELSDTIVKKILDANSKPPAAVFLIGGGSQIPCLKDMVAQGLGLDKNRVAIGGKNTLKSVVYADNALSGPEFVTPLGIALTAVIQQGFDFFAITINNKKIKLISTKNLKVIDALLLAGYKITQLIGISGRSIHYELNGEKRVIRGSLAQNAQITLNGKEASIETKVRPGDVLEIDIAQNGNDATARLGDIIKYMPNSNIIFDDSEAEIGTIAEINGRRAYQDDKIKNGDKIISKDIKNLAELCQELGLEHKDYDFYINNQAADFTIALNSGDEIIYFEEDDNSIEWDSHELTDDNSIFSALESMPNEKQKSEISENDTALKETSISLEKAQHEIIDNDTEQTSEQSNMLSIVLNGKRVALEAREGGYLFLDMFNLVDIDPTKPEGNAILTLNGKDASFMAPIKSGDDVNIKWEKI